MPGRCMCGAPDCPQCFPATWWHSPFCDGTENCGCEDPLEFEPEIWDDPEEEARLEQLANADYTPREDGY